jgi:hypothetical protein
MTHVNVVEISGIAYKLLTDKFSLESKVSVLNWLLFMGKVTFLSRKIYRAI